MGFVLCERAPNSLLYLCETERKYITYQKGDQGSLIQVISQIRKWRIG